MTAARVIDNVVSLDPLSESPSAERDLQRFITEQDEQGQEIKDGLVRGQQIMVRNERQHQPRRDQGTVNYRGDQARVYVGTRISHALPELSAHMKDRVQHIDTDCLGDADADLLRESIQNAAFRCVVDDLLRTDHFPGDIGRISEIVD